MASHLSIARLPLARCASTPIATHHVRCTTDLRRSKTVQHHRRSANYQPSSWNYESLQSLKTECKDELHEWQFDELKEKVRHSIAGETELVAQLEMINDMQRMGVDYHFDEEIKEVLSSASIINPEMVLKDDLYATALRFRLLREYGFQASQGLFERFKEETYGFCRFSQEDFRGILSLYEASHLAFKGETILDEARFETTKYLTRLKKYIPPHIKKDVSFSLELPNHWRIRRMLVRRYLDQQKESDQCTNPLLLQLAVQEFNNVHRLHQMEIKEMARWRKKLCLMEKLPFARDRTIECFFFAMGIVSEPHLGYCRERVAKVCTLITIIDDLYDIYGSLDELILLTDSIQRWESTIVEELPECMRTCYAILYNTVNELAHDIQKTDGWDALPCLKKAWVDLCNSFLVEEKWHHLGSTPTFQEYMENSWISVSGHVVLTHALLLSGQLKNEVLNWRQNYPRIVRSSSMIFRLCNDLATSKAEQDRGDAPTSIECYKHEHYVSELDSRKAIQDIIIEIWKELNEDVHESNHSSYLSTISVNLARVAHSIYQNGDGVGAPDQDMKNWVKLLLFEPITI